MATTTHALPLAEGGNRNTILLALGSIYLIWGSTYLAISYALESFPPFFLSALRFSISALVLFAWLGLRQRDALPTARRAMNAMLVGALTLGIANTAVAFAEQYVSSGLAALAVAAVPLWTAIFAALLVARPKRLEWIGILIGFSGIVLLNFDSSMTAQPQGALPLILGPISWSFGSILSRRLRLPEGLMAVAFEILGAALLMVIVSLVTGTGAKEVVTPSAILAVLYLAFIGSVVGYTAYMYLMKTVSPALATSYAYVNPVVALLLGALLAEEARHITPLVILAAIITLSGVVLVAYASSQRRTPTAETAA